MCLRIWCGARLERQPGMRSQRAFSASVRIWSFILKAGTSPCSLLFSPQPSPEGDTVQWALQEAHGGGGGEWLCGVTISNYLACRPSATLGPLPGSPGMIHWDHRQHSADLAATGEALTAIWSSFTEFAKALSHVFSGTWQAKDRKGHVGGGGWGEREQMRATQVIRLPGSLVLTHRKGWQFRALTVHQHLCHRLIFLTASRARNSCAKHRLTTLECPVTHLSVGRIHLPVSATSPQILPPSKARNQGSSQAQLLHISKRRKLWYWSPP